MKIGGLIRGWYEKNKRALPWRQTSDPYKVWLSEVILQQTRVDQGLNYYLAFVKSFPDISSLARASEDEVLKMWQGLGYYSRARNLHHSAKVVADQMKGVFPDSYEELLQLKGVGTYTASAIASICFGEAKAVVDGNVSRVIARLNGVDDPVNSNRGSNIIQSLAQELLDPEQPGNHNQAIMEFGAIQCVPQSPDCPQCPLLEHCEAGRSGRAVDFPVKIPKRKPVKLWMYFYILFNNGETIITKRGTDSIWRSLYQFPMIESHESSSDLEIMEIHLNKLIPAQKHRITMISDPILHLLSHRTIHARFIHVEMDSWPQPLPSEWIKISADRMGDFPVPRLINRYMEVAKI